MQPRSVSPPSSFMGPLGHGGTISSPCSRPTTWLSGESSKWHSEGITYQQTSWIASSMSFWHSLREVVPCCSMPKLSMTCVRTQATMLTLMRRRETGSGGASTLSSATVSTQSGPTTTTIWSTWPSLRRIASQLARQRRRGRSLRQGHQHNLSALGLCSTLRAEDLSSSRGDGRSSHNSSSRHPIALKPQLRGITIISSTARAMTTDASPMAAPDTMPRIVLGTSRGWVRMQLRTKARGRRFK
jgi:hypothetical protein